MGLKGRITTEGGEQKKTSAPAVSGETFILSVCVSASAAGCQVTSGQRSRRGCEWERQ